ncbi:hypothetical protein DFH09DRAFT_1367074 [Mycena vulgaris]|nr:hypothetical protein DFH09DRAFT_1367074 [Mycena vulgaris]
MQPVSLLDYRWLVIPITSPTSARQPAPQCAAQPRPRPPSKSSTPAPRFSTCSSVIPRPPLPPVRRHKQPARVERCKCALLLLPSDLAQLHALHQKARLRPTTPSADSCARRLPPSACRALRLVSPPSSAPQCTVARARPPFAFPLLALAGALHSVAPHIHGNTDGGGSARLASALRPKMYSSQERAEAPQSQLPLHLLPAYATQRDGVLHPRRASAFAYPHLIAPTSPPSTSDAPPQIEAAAALNGRRRGGGVAVADVGIDVEEEEVWSTGDGLRGVDVELERAFLGAGASPLSAGTQ